MADVESVMVAGLAQATGVVVSTEAPAQVSGPYIQVRAAGGVGRHDLVLDGRNVTLSVCHDSAPEAARLADVTVAAIDNLAGTTVGNVFITDASCSAPAWFPNEDGKPRYVMNAQLLIHETTTT